MKKEIRLLVEGFFDDDIFNLKEDINLDILNIGDRYYDYHIGDIYYKDNEPYAICCGEPKYFNNNKPRFCLLENSGKHLEWSVENKLVKELGCFKFKNLNLKSFNDFKHIDEDGYENTQIIKNNYNINKFPAFKYCINLGDNIYLPAIDELLIMYLNKDNLSKYSFRGYLYCSSTLFSASDACCINTDGYFGKLCKYYKINVRPFFRLD